MPPITFRIKKIPVKECLSCGGEFEQTVRPSGYKESIGTFRNRKYCSSGCAKKGLEEYRRDLAKTMIRKGKEPWNKGKYTSKSYSTIHKWLANHQDKSGRCQLCNKGGRTCWANISGVYERDMKNFAELCYSCHNLLDKADKQVKEKMISSIDAL